jgi:transposase
VAAAIDFTFARAEVAPTYGYNGHVSVDPAVILKMMFLLFFENIPSERQLMALIPERLDYLWFLGYGLNDPIPDHSVLSKARARWGTEVFRKLFVRTIAACLAAGLVDGKKIHVDGSLIAAHASTDSVISGPPEVIAALRQTYQEQAAKLAEPLPPPPRGQANQRHLSTTDPDAELARGRRTPSRPSYKLHRVVDNAQGVITAQVTTGGSIREETQLFGLIQQHQQHTAVAVQTVVADAQYGTAENFLGCVERGIAPHMADLKRVQGRGSAEGIFGQDQFVYDGATDTYRCPAGQVLRRWERQPQRHATVYMAGPAKCRGCPLRAQCTRAKDGRRLLRFDRHDAIEAARAQSHSGAARRDRLRRRHLMEGSFADAANCHHFKRARWRRLWRQHIQNSLIAACQNIRILLRAQARRLRGALAQVIALTVGVHARVLGRFLGLGAPEDADREIFIMRATATAIFDRRFSNDPLGNTPFSWVLMRIAKSKVLMKNSGRSTPLL